MLSRAWQVSLWRLAGLLAVATAIGLWIGALPTAWLVAVGGWLALTLVQLRRLGRLLDSTVLLQPTSERDIWGRIRQRLYQRQQATRGARRRLLELLRGFRDGASALPDGVVVLDPERRILWFNTAARELLGLDPRHDPGGEITHLLRAPRILQWFAEGAEPALTDVASPVDDRIRLSLRRIPYADGRSLLVARDISQLQRLEQVRRDFVANVSHELRTPLTVVHGYLDMIEPESLPEYEPILRELRMQSRRMTQIVEDLLTLSRLEAQQSTPDERVVMPALLESLRREAAALSQGRHEIVLERLGDMDLQGSTKDLHSAFSNLVSNAVRYTPDGGRIVLRWECDADGARLTVIDTGPGIPSQHLPRLTERFYRVSTSRSRESGGTGLGLSIVKHVLQLHQARLDIRSEVGVGSRFICVFGPERLLPARTLAEEA
ncbi:phosphate regulon sensor histidine kinase PhoR [Dokdonella koreensis]|uniref:Phosphate regulon sensor protein PhoR n=1 Tax=Dokdonella koreensis DS-123 TaxID=1300342 RepID=A0A160DWV2_9GAMM|nr:Two-component system sensor protein [Dokdonella koreensis DS-123]